MIHNLTLKRYFIWIHANIMLIYKIVLGYTRPYNKSSNTNRPIRISFIYININK